MKEAATRIGRIAGITLIARSRIYETAPVGPPQPGFLNAAVLVQCTLSPLALLGELLRIERELGRTRGVTDVRWGPRAIDLDVLWIEDVALDDEHLVVPHPRLKERAFALVPLLEIVPKATDPRTGAPFVLPADIGGVRPTDASWDA
jgi:2-amino-4-hydroxy-6-hydroxymethyldihydropteridine diphosphokinase